jgi:hypothetical protein
MPNELRILVGALAARTAAWATIASAFAHRKNLMPQSAIVAVGRASFFSLAR